MGGLGHCGIKGIKGMEGCGDWVDREDWGIGDQGSRIFSLLLQLFFSQKLTNGGLGDRGSGDQQPGTSIFTLLLQLFFSQKLTKF